MRRRGFFARMRGMVLPGLLLAALPAGAAEGQRESSESGRPLRIHLLSGSAEYRSEESLRGLAKDLESRFQVQCTASWAHDKGTEADGLEALERADLLIVFARRLSLPEKQMRLLRQHWQAGKPVLGIRTASHAFQEIDNQVFDRPVLGGNYQGHYGDEPVRVAAAAGMETHPVLRGVEPWTSTKLYKEGELGPGTVVLQIGDNGLAAHPVTFVHTYRGGRTFYTSLGTPEDFANENFRQLLVNAVFWTTRRDPARMER